MLRTRPFIIISGWLFAVLAATACSKSTPSNPTTTTCTFTVAQPSVATFPPEGGTSSASVTTGSTCAWTATSSAAFVTLTSGASGTGNGTTAFSVAVNTGAERTATLTIAGTAVTITQRAAAV